MSRRGYKANRKADPSWKSAIDVSTTQWNFELIKCEAEECQCPHGRKYEATLKDAEHEGEGPDWVMLLCSGCGSNGEHVKCAGFDEVPEADYYCEPCTYGAIYE